jgi:glycosyltransferase involved in cell wall biosynthesis
MRIAQIHNVYQIAGGEDRVVGLERSLLAQNGHDVLQYFVTNDAIAGLKSKAAALAGTPYNLASRNALAAWLMREKPDIVHVHNFFPLLSPSIYEACTDAGVPLVQTLHNFRTQCAGALLLRNGKFCDLCVGRLPLWGIAHRCYRGSLPGSAAVAAMIMSYRRHQHRVQRFIALSAFARDVFVKSGMPADRIVLKPNFVTDPGAPPVAPRSGGLYVGRLSEEKGIEQLISAWTGNNADLRIAGTGPLEGALKARAPKSAQFLGWMQADAIRDEMWRSAFLVAPSLSTEQFPMALAEAFSCGLPVITSRSDALAEIVTEGETGLLCAPGDSGELRARIEWALAHPQEMARMGRAARAQYEALYSDRTNYELLMRIYGDAKDEMRKDTTGKGPSAADS